MVKPEGTFGKILAFLSIGFLIFNILLLVYGVLISVSNLPLIEALSSSQFLLVNFTITPVFAYFIFGVTFALVFAAVLTFFTGDRIRTGKRGNSTWQYGKYFVIFVLLELSFSEIESYINPSLSSSFPYNLPVASENFVLASSVLVETLIQFLVLGLVLVIYYLFTNHNTETRFLDMDISMRNTALISLVSAVPIAIFSGGTPLELAGTFITFAFLNVAFIRVGFLKGMTMNFSITMSNLFISVAGATSIYSGILTYVLLFFSILALVAIFTFIPLNPGSRTVRTGDTFEEISRSVEAHKEETVGGDASSLLFIRSSCPTCGNATFLLGDNMSMKCMKCGHEIDKDAIGDPNISLRVARGYRN